MFPAPLPRLPDIVDHVESVEEGERHRHGPVDTTATSAVAAAIIDSRLRIYRNVLSVLI
jgi:hypothetical protein